MFGLVHLVGALIDSLPGLQKRAVGGMQIIPLDVHPCFPRLAGRTGRNTSDASPDAQSLQQGANRVVAELSQAAI
jgi:hypothetical protein